MNKYQTPYYYIDENKLLKNLEKMDYIRNNSNTKFVLATKCFASPHVFPLMRKYMDGTTSSSLYEAKLGYEKFGKEVHGYSVAFSDSDIEELRKYATKIIFNSTSQLERYYEKVKNIQIGLRVNPKISFSSFTLADPARKYSRLGVTKKEDISKYIDKVSGLMFHFNCENDDFANFSQNIDHISLKYEEFLKKVKWVSFGGGIYFSKDNYPLDQLSNKLKDFQEKFEVQVYLEPGESAISNSGELVTKVLDIVNNETDIAIVDSSIEAHMLDLLTYQLQAKIDSSKSDRYKYIIAGKSCLAGDIFGTYYFDKKINIGDEIRIQDALGYSIVKKNWFNGLQMPSIVVKRLSGKEELVKSFSYKDYINSL